MTYQEVKKLLEDLKRSKRLCLRYKDEIAAIKDDYGALSSPVGSFGTAEVSFNHSDNNAVNRAVRIPTGAV